MMNDEWAANSPVHHSSFIVHHLRERTLHMTQVLAAFIAIPYGLSVLMRGSDGLNRGMYTAREAGLLAGIGGALILTSLAMLMGFRYAGFLTVIALVLGAIVALKQQHDRRGSIGASDVAMRFLLPAFLTLLIAAGL
jgi:hypothetical protein